MPNAVRQTSESAAAEMLATARADLACYALAHFPQFELPAFLELVVSKLEAVERGDVKRLIISMPPRHGKSIVGSTYFPAWYLGRHPDHYVIAASYAQDLADDFGRRVRNVVRSSLHRAIFPGSRMADDSGAISRFNLDAGGAYFAVGRGAAITGRGAHVLLIDDPLKDSSEANSPTIRRQLQEWFGQVAFTRLMPGGAVVIIQTRWHEADLAGWLLSEFASEGWESIALPAIGEENDPLGRVVGAALWPERYSLESLDSIRRQLGSVPFASLYQQRPAPVEGRMFRRAWFQFYALPPTSFTQIVLSIDSAFKKGEEADFSAFTIWGNTRSSGIYLLHAWRGKVEFPDLKKKVIEFAQQWHPHAVLVEDKASGQSLIQELKRDANLPVIAVKVDKDKITRAAAVTPLFEAGKVQFPQSAGWLEEYIDELATFPAAAHDDYVDSTTQALDRLSHGGLGVGHNSIEAWRRIAEGSPQVGPSAMASAGSAGPEAVRRRIQIARLDEATFRRVMNACWEVQCQTHGAEVRFTLAESGYELRGCCEAVVAVAETVAAKHVMPRG